MKGARAPVRMWPMSVDEIMAEVGKLPPEQQRDIVRGILDVQNPNLEKSDGCHLEVRDGYLMLVTPRVIRQEEVDAILLDFP